MGLGNCKLFCPKHRGVTGVRWEGHAMDIQAVFGAPTTCAYTAFSTWLGFRAESTREEGTVLERG